MEMLCCETCGNTWTSMEAKEIMRAAKVNKEGPFCNSCCYIEMARRHAIAGGISLKQAVKSYLEGTAQKTGKTEDELWKGTRA